MNSSLSTSNSAMAEVILTPHISESAQSPRFLDRIWDIFVQNVECWLSGQPLLNELSPHS